VIRGLRNYWAKLRRPRPEISAPDLAAEISQIRKRSSVIALAGKPYENNWRGVYNGALEMFPGGLLGLPHFYSRNIYSPQELAFISDAIAQEQFERIVFTGYAQFLRELMLPLFNNSNAGSKKNIYLIYHGSLSQNADRSRDAAYLREIIELHQRGIIHKIGFMKKGLPETLNKVAGIKSEFLITIVNEHAGMNVAPANGFNIGVFTHDSFRKNFHNQVAAALMFDDAMVHVHQNENLEYLQSNHRLKIHPFSESYEDFLRTLGSMTMNFYVTFSECYGMVIAESLSLGVPCLAGNSSGIFDSNNELARWLLVEEYDNAEAIFHQAQKVLENREQISKMGKEYIPHLNSIAREKLKNFLQD